MDERDKVVEQACSWREKQKARIAARDAKAKAEAKNKELHAKRKLEEAVDNYQSKRDDK
jgi:hypothetical protein